MRKSYGQLKNVLMNFSSREDLKMNDENYFSIPMNRDQWRTVIDALLDKYPDSDCVDLIVSKIPDITNYRG